MTRRLPPVAVGLAILGGLLLVGATSGDWVTAQELREIGGVPLVDDRATAGTVFAPQAVAAGLVATLAGLALIVVRGRGRRVLGLLLLATGTAAAGLVAVGIAQAAAAAGDLTAAPWVAAAGAAATVGAGAVAWGRPAPPPALGERYSIDPDPARDEGEWDAASDER